MNTEQVTLQIPWNSKRPLRDWKRAAVAAVLAVIPTGHRSQGHVFVHVRHGQQANVTASVQTVRTRR